MSAWLPIRNDQFLEHKSLKIFNVYAGDVYAKENKRVYWFTTDPFGSETGSAVFDIRDLAESLSEKTGHPFPLDTEDQQAVVLKAAIDAGLIVFKKDGD